MTSRLLDVLGDVAKTVAYRCGVFPREVQIWSPLKRIELAEAFAVLDAGPDAVVLDLCCGSGLPGQILARRTERVIGIDIDPSQLAAAGWHRRRSRVGSRLDLLRADAGSLPLAAGAVDACFSLCAIEHLVDASRALREVHRVLVPGGLLVLTADSLATAPPSFPLGRHTEAYSVITYYTVTSLASLLESTEFTVESCRPILRSRLASEELSASMDRKTGLGPIAAERRRRQLDAAERAEAGDRGLFVLAIARKPT
jgi:ubiquinone/menaquinone biosynthesis C-methylase UbiE